MEEKEDIIEQIKRRRNESLSELKEKIASINEDALFADGFDSCLIGYDSLGRCAYSADMIVQTLMERDDMSYEDALEFYGFNIEGAYVGEFTPIYLWE